MNNFSNFKVHFPVELFEEWIKEHGTGDGQISENQVVTLTEISYDEDTGYVSVGCDLETVLDS